MSATADSLSDALVAALAAKAPVGCTVTDHKVLPISPDQIPAAGYLCVWLFDDQPKVDGYTDSTLRHERVATFKVCIRTKGDPTDTGWNILHATRALRAVVAQAVVADESFGNLALGSRVMGWRPQAVETTLSIGAAEVDIAIDYYFDPEVA